MRLAPVMLAVALAAPLAASGATNVWHVWEHKILKACPTHHVDWIGNGTYDELLEAFEQTLPAAKVKQISVMADLNKRCAGEIAGRSCEMHASLQVYQRLGLMDRFVAFGCRNVKCEDVALCSHFLAHRYKGL
jgi:hypothetical protein